MFQFWFIGVWLLLDDSSQFKINDNAAHKKVTQSTDQVFFYCPEHWPVVKNTKKPDPIAGCCSANDLQIRYKAKKSTQAKTGDIAKNRDYKAKKKWQSQKQGLKRKKTGAEAL